MHHASCARQKRKNVKGEKRKRETKKEKEGIKNR